MYVYIRLIIITCLVLLAVMYFCVSMSRMKVSPALAPVCDVTLFPLNGSSWLAFVLNVKQLP